MKSIINAKIITETGVLENHVLSFGKTFSTITPAREFSDRDNEIFDAEGLYAAPGLVDVHCHGSGGKDVMDDDPEAIRTISSTIIKNGVTSFLPTTMTMSLPQIKRALEHVRSSMNEEMPGAQVLGAHMEGPFLNKDFKGAQHSEYIIPPDWSLVEPFTDVIKIVTIAPELEGAEHFIENAKSAGLVISMGHTAASYEEANLGACYGVTHCTHLFNAMTGVHHRNPGAAAFALASERIYCELIADKIHIHPGLFELVRKAKGTDRITLITDCMEAGGMPDGEYALGGQPVTVKNKSARLADGTIAGSILNLNKGLYNFYKNTKAQLHEVFLMGSLNPAREIKADHEKGSIAVGKHADFSLMDEEFNVQRTYVRGVCKFSV